MAALIYALCAVVALLCAWLLLAAYRRQNYRLLLWSGLCFAVLHREQRPAGARQGGLS